MFDRNLYDQAELLLERFRDRGLMLATAESCTGGLIAGLLTEIAGSSDVVECGFVTYSNRAKRDALGVPEALLVRFGAVSAEVARAMVEGALARSPADVAVAVTGIAGPGGGSAEKPVGLVYLAAGRRGRPVLVEKQRFEGDRSAVRRATVVRAMELALSQAEPPRPA